MSRDLEYVPVADAPTAAQSARPEPAFFDPDAVEKWDEDEQQWTIESRAYLSTLTAPPSFESLLSEKEWGNFKASNLSLRESLNNKILSLPLVPIFELSTETRSAVLEGRQKVVAALRGRLKPAEGVPPLAEKLIDKYTQERINQELPTSTGSARWRGEKGKDQGGMSDLLMAWDTKLWKFVAVKRAWSNVRTRQEAMAVSALRHPNLLEILDLAQIGPDLAFVMEFIPPSKGATMNDSLKNQDHFFYLKENRPKTLQDKQSALAQTVRELGSVLDYLHSHGQGHLDIKPANVFLTTQGVKLIDFGASMSLQSSLPPRPDTRLGTRGYLSKHRLDTYSHKDIKSVRSSDLFSLAVTLYEYFSGQRLLATSKFADASKRLENFPDIKLSQSMESSNLLSRNARALARQLTVLGLDLRRQDEVSQVLWRAMTGQPTPYERVSEFTDDLAQILQPRDERTSA